jgi:hypothetical protein
VAPGTQWAAHLRVATRLDLPPTAELDAETVGKLKEVAGV